LDAAVAREVADELPGLAAARAPRLPADHGRRVHHVAVDAERLVLLTGLDDPRGILPRPLRLDRRLALHQLVAVLIRARPPRRPVRRVEPAPALVRATQQLPPLVALAVVRQVLRQVPRALGDERPEVDAHV